MEPISLTFYGHASFLIEVAGTKLLFDPFIKENPLAKDIDFEAIQADYILLSHGHFDHTADAIALAKRNDAMIVSNYEIGSWAMNQGVEKVHQMNHGGKWQFDFGTVKYVNAVHTSSFADGSYAGNPGGFIIECAGRCFYYSGDTALTYDMKLFGMQHALEFSILPIGDNFTMGIEDAVIASKFLNCDKVVGVHYDTFGYIVIDKEDALKAFKAKNKTLLLPVVGETITL